MSVVTNNTIIILIKKVGRVYMLFTYIAIMLKSIRIIVKIVIDLTVFSELENRS